MAKDPKQERELHELRQQIAHSRDHVARDLSGMRYELDIPLKFRKSFQRRAPVWISAAILTGVVFTARAFPTKQKIVYADSKSGQKKKGEEQKKGLLQAGLAMGVLKFAATMLRPVVISFVTKKLGGYSSTAPGTNRRW